MNGTSPHTGSDTSRRVDGGRRPARARAAGVFVTAAAIWAGTAPAQAEIPPYPISVAARVTPSVVPFGTTATLTYSAQFDPFLGGSCWLGVPGRSPAPLPGASGTVELPLLSSHVSKASSLDALTLDVESGTPLRASRTHNITVSCSDFLAGSGSASARLTVEPPPGGRGYVIVQHASDPVFDKPVLVLEGIDPGNDRFEEDVFVDEIPFEFARQLFATGRELVLVSFPDGGAQIETNAFEVQRIIGEIKARKQGAHPLAVIGASMGGLVARYALTTMESMGIDHATSLYMTIDSPHRGASAPMDILEGLDDLLDRVEDLPGAIRGDSRKLIRRGIRQFNSPASEQQLVWKPEAENFYRKLDRFGHPNRPTRVAVTNGSVTGLAQGYPDPFLATEYELTIARVSDLHQQLYYRSLPANRCFYPCDPTKSTFYEGAPGGTRNSVMELHDLLSDASKKIDGFTARFSGYRPDRPHAFVPTVSALDLRNVGLFDALTSARIALSPFDEIISRALNSEHVDLTPFGAEVISAILRYHDPRSQAPLRQFRPQPLGDVSGPLRITARGGARYDITWSAISGAARYEIFANQNGRVVRLATVSGPSGSVDLGSSTAQTVYVRACNSLVCSYPASGRAEPGASAPPLPPAGGLDACLAQCADIDCAVRCLDQYPIGPIDIPGIGCSEGGAAERPECF